ncbi:hypothetical protein BK123_19305 [Paenibacillus lautus]|uniref:Uncharacterized protein n=1 Tax=Paenibacillus lautus TaxID=1401 RepID=A0A1R1AZX5_PAELA|nr:hypothetical protein BK123_19305 [Paenibacillus lautus]
MTGYSRFQGLTSLLGLIYFLDMPVMDKSKMSTKQGAARVGLAVQTRNKKKDRITRSCPLQVRGGRMATKK